MIALAAGLMLWFTLATLVTTGTPRTAFGWAAGVSTLGTILLIVDRHDRCRR